MQKYEVSREIYNPCAGIYNFDMNFEEEVCTDAYLAKDFLSEGMSGLCIRHRLQVLSPGDCVCI